MKAVNLIVCLLCCSFLSFAQSFSEPTTQRLPADTLALQRSYFTKRINGKAPVLDGRPDEAIWNTVAWSGGFVQRQPYEGHAPSKATRFKILYDDKFLYVAYHNFDPEPDKVVRRMSRRDGFDGDWVEINIDSYFDKRTAFSFTISASGVKGDELVSNNGDNWDDSWNPIWYAKTSPDPQGWTAEVKIPFSQLRFASKEDMVWGLQFTRMDFRKNERSVWQFLPQNAGVWVSQFGELRGLKGLKPQKQVELQPYLLAQAESFEKEEGNPFVTGTAQKLSAGIDGKVAVTSDLMLDFTINPDFGQVDADPSVVNLDGYQVFFSERRPFFVENRNIFNYRLTGSEAGGGFDRDLIFYSRRIGGAPKGEPDKEDWEYTDLPINTSILGAAKFSGKTQKGLSIGILEAVTAKEIAEIDNRGERREEVVEPLTSYFVGRVQQDFDGGNTIIGGVFTATNRQLDNTNLDFLSRSAYTGGLDFTRQWKDQSWIFSAKGLFSAISGSRESMRLVQESFEHYFQRPDAEHLEVDTAATSLAGHGGTVKLAKFGGNWRFETGVTWRSPNLELNDIGFLSGADEINHFAWTGYRITDPFGPFRRASFNYNHWARWDFSGRNIYRAINVNMHFQFKNNWEMGSGISHDNLDISTKALRGGPALRRPSGIGNFFYVGTGEQNKINFYFNMNHGWGFEKTVRYRRYSPGFVVQPMNALKISFFPAWTQFSRPIQYVGQEGFQAQTRYITGAVQQKTLSASIRVNYSITPDLSIQYYGQPFITQINYDEFKYITNPLAEKHADRYAVYPDEKLTFSEKQDKYLVDENLDGKVDYRFNNPDFSTVEFRSNLVLRWEYIAGSELFLVWSQGNTSFPDEKGRLLNTLADRLFSNQAHNIFLLKCTYRFIK
ncbi:MAG: DUF5916 domain-containing protein [Bacteroidota bacterium]